MITLVKKLRVLFACAIGMSSSLLETRTKEAAKKRGIELELEAIPITNFYKYDIDGLDCILLGPQIRHKLKEVEKRASEFGIPVGVIDFQTYGMVDGEKTLKLILELVGKKTQQ
ncbi:MAG: PTS sugar transporter subunit IIB [Candidatus Odinarchaeota archaeon]|nr:PTS sugar transporter subunit IIB [Candidatus Odinarchaeota archaeon]